MFELKASAPLGHDESVNAMERIRARRDEVSR